MSEDWFFAREVLVDMVRVALAFENALKAKLIYDGYLIHLFDISSELSKEWSAELNKVVAKSGMTIDELNSLTFCEGQSGQYWYEGLGSRTLGFSQTLKLCQSVSGLPESISEVLRRLSVSRNQLHFMLAEARLMQFDPLGQLISYFDNVLVKLQHDIVDELGGSTKKLNIGQTSLNPKPRRQPATPPADPSSPATPPPLRAS